MTSYYFAVKIKTLFDRKKIYKGNKENSYIDIVKRFSINKGFKLDKENFILYSGTYIRIMCIKQKGDKFYG